MRLVRCKSEPTMVGSHICVSAMFECTNCTRKIGFLIGSLEERLEMRSTSCPYCSASFSVNVEGPSEIALKLAATMVEFNRLSDMCTSIGVDARRLTLSITEHNKLWREVRSVRWSGMSQLLVEGQSWILALPAEGLRS